jgi:hypothetical protein
MMEKEMDKKFAVFIDGDNIAPQYLDSIFAEISKDGELLVKRIYGDWTTTNMGSWKVKVFETPVRIFPAIPLRSKCYRQQHHHGCN